MAEDRGVDAGNWSKHQGVKNGAEKKWNFIFYVGRGRGGVWERDGVRLPSVSVAGL